MKSVTATDVLQFLVLLVILPIIVSTVLQHAGGMQKVLTSAPAEKFIILEHPDFFYYVVLFLSFSIFQFNIIDPAPMQRFLMGRTKEELRNQCFALAGFYITILGAFSLIGLAGYELYPDLKSTQLVPHIINELLPSGVKGIAITGILMANISTIDSYLHAAGLSFVHDVAKPICNRQSIAIDELKWVRYATLVIGLAAIFIGFVRTDDLYSFIVTSFQFTGPLLMFPLLAGIVGLKPHRGAFYTAASATLVMFIISRLLLPEQYADLAVLISAASSIFVFLLVHYTVNKGFVFVDYNGEQPAHYYWKKPNARSTKDYLKRFIPTPQRIVDYSQRSVKDYGAPYILFGTFYSINYVLPYFMWSHSHPSTFNFMIYLRIVGIMVCGLLIVKDKWYKPLKFLFPTFWHLTLLYCLPFTSTVMFLITQGAQEWLVNIFATTIFLIVLVDWLTFIILALLGIALGYVFYYYAIGPIVLELSFSQGYQLVYQIIFSTVIGLLFARRKELSFDTLKQKHRRLLSAHQDMSVELLKAFVDKLRVLHVLKQAGVDHISRIGSMARKLCLNLTNDPKNAALAEEIKEALIPMTLATENITQRATDYLRLDSCDTTIDELLTGTLDKLREQDLHHNLYFKIHTQGQNISCDPVYLGQALFNAVSILRAVVQKEADIYIHINDTKLSYKLNFSEALPSKDVDAFCFSCTTQATPPSVEDKYKVDLNGKVPQVPQSIQEVMLMVSRRIIKAHYGHIHLPEGIDSHTHTYVVPTAIREVRPKDMDKPYMELNAKIVEANDQYPGAQEQEQALLKAVEERTTADIKAVQLALKMIKVCHGPVNRRSGEPFYLHPVTVAQIVLDYDQDEATVIGALLHDAVEDTPLMLSQIEMIFGEEVVCIVDGLTHLESYAHSFYKVLLSQQYNLPLLLGIKDPRVICIKVADRIHNLRTIHAKPIESQKRTAKETINFYVPLARSIGLYDASDEMLKLSQEILNQGK